VRTGTGTGASRSSRPSSRAKRLMIWSAVEGPMLVGFISTPFRQRRTTRPFVCTSRARRWITLAEASWSCDAERSASGVPPVLHKSKACANLAGNRIALWSCSLRPVGNVAAVRAAGPRS